MDGAPCMYLIEGVGYRTIQHAWYAVWHHGLSICTSIIHSEVPPPAPPPPQIVISLRDDHY